MALAQSVYSKISDIIKRRISLGVYKVGDKLSNEHELSREFDVSRVTIRKSLALLEKERLIMRVPKRGTVVVDPLLSHEINMVGLSSLFSSSPAEFLNYHVMADISQGIMEEAFANKMKVKYTWLDPKNDKSYKNIYKILERDSQAPFIFISPNKFEPFIEEIASQKANYVLSHVYDCSFNSVVVDFESGAFDMTTHLIKKGHKRIALILYGANNFDEYFLSRLNGYKKALGSAGIAFDNSLVKKNTAVNINTTKALKELFSLKNPPSAIFCATDRIALDVISRLQKKKKAIPEDISVAGFDNILPAFYTEPALTTVDTMRYESGVEAVKLLRKILDKAPRGILKTRIKPKVIVRESA
jgi:DNA-binding LacI/PurR family transcriptional regulator